MGLRERCLVITYPCHPYGALHWRWTVDGVGSGGVHWPELTWVRSGRGGPPRMESGPNRLHRNLVDLPVCSLQWPLGGPWGGRSSSWCTPRDTDIWCTWGRKMERDKWITNDSNVFRVWSTYCVRRVKAAEVIEDGKPSPLIISCQSFLLMTSTRPPRAMTRLNSS